jgi:serine/threonine protein kinase
VIAVLYSLLQRRWQLCDFGTSAAATSKRLVATNYGRGTGGYRAPEVLEEGVYNNKSDQFALGCIVFELTFGTKLFRNEDWRVQIFSRDPDVVFSTLWPSGQNSEMLKTFRQLVFSLIAIDPSARPSALETKVTLESIREVIARERETMDRSYSKATIIVPTDNLNRPQDDNGGGVGQDGGVATGDGGGGGSASDGRVARKDESGGGYESGVEHVAAEDESGGGYESGVSYPFDRQVPPEDEDESGVSYSSHRQVAPDDESGGGYESGGGNVAAEDKGGVASDGGW